MPLGARFDMQRRISPFKLGQFSMLLSERLYLNESEIV